MSAWNLLSQQTTVWKRGFHFERTTWQRSVDAKLLCERIKKRCGYTHQYCAGRLTSFKHINDFHSADVNEPFVKMSVNCLFVRSSRIGMAESKLVRSSNLRHLMVTRLLASLVLNHVQLRMTK